jgi:putative transposase
MPRRDVPLLPGECYHVYNRGVNRQRLFHSDDNYVYFLRKAREYLLGEPKSASILDAQSIQDASAWQRPLTILAWCLMPNHFHLLVRLNCEDFSTRMKSLGKSYTQAINRAESRTGPLFGGRFQAIHVPDVVYLLHLSRYIHRNPVEAGLVVSPADWEYSSYRDYIGHRDGTLASPQIILGEFGSIAAYRRFCEFESPTVDISQLLPKE